MGLAGLAEAYFHAAPGRVGLSRNPENNGDPSKSPRKNYFALVGTDVHVTLDGSTFAVGRTHLLLGRMVLDQGDDTFKLWVDLADLESLGLAELSVTDIDFLDALTGLGVMSYNPVGPAWSANGGLLDAPRATATPPTSSSPSPACLSRPRRWAPTCYCRRGRLSCGQWQAVNVPI